MRVNKETISFNHSFIQIVYRFLVGRDEDSKVTWRREMDRGSAVGVVRATQPHSEHQSGRLHRRGGLGL